MHRVYKSNNLGNKSEECLEMVKKSFEFNVARGSFVAWDSREVPQTPKTHQQQQTILLLTPPPAFARHHHSHSLAIITHTRPPNLASFSSGFRISSLKIVPFFHSTLNFPLVSCIFCMFSLWAILPMLVWNHSMFLSA